MSSYQQPVYMTVLEQKHLWDQCAKIKRDTSPVFEFSGASQLSESYHPLVLFGDRCSFRRHGGPGIFVQARV